MNRNCVKMLILLFLIPGLLILPRCRAEGKGYDDRAFIDELVMYDVSQSEIEFIGSLNGLRRLEISILSDDGVDLTPLANLQELQELDISIRGIPWYEKTDMSQLGELKQLKKLCISECSSDMAFINEMTNLQELIINKSSIDDLSFLKGLAELRYLDLKYVSDCDLSYLNGMPKMNELYIQGYRMRNFECLKEMKYLSRVSLDGTEINKESVSDIDLCFFSEADRLSKLFIQGRHVPDVTPVSMLPCLEKIVFVDTGITDIESLGNLESLSELEIYGYGDWHVIEQAFSISGLDRLVVTDDIPGFYSH